MDEEETGNIKLIYSAVGPAGEILVSEKRTDEREVKVPINAEGISEIVAYTTNEDGESSTTVAKHIKIDRIAPDKPTIKINGTQNTEQGWHKGDIEVTIIGGDDKGGSGAAKIKYKVEGAYEIKETILNKPEVTFKITKDGESTITAYTIDVAGHISEEASSEKVVRVTGSLVVGLEVVKIEEDAIRVNANVLFAVNDIKSYAFKYKMSSASSYVAAETITTDATTRMSHISELDANTPYDIQVTVTDTKNVTYTATLKEIWTSRNIKKGDFVDYKPDKKTYATNTIYTGYKTSESFTTQDVKWAIWSYDDKTR